MPIKITVSVTGKDGQKTKLVHKVPIGELGLTRKEANDDFHRKIATDDYILENMVRVKLEKVKR